MTTILMTGLLLVAMAASSRAATFPPDVQAALRSQSEIYVATKRADGSRSKAVPVWFWWDGKVVYFTTSPDSHKAKRIRKGSSVFVAVSKDGPFFEGKAEVINDLELVEKLGAEYSNKYWIARLGLIRPRPERVKSGKTVAVKVVFDVAG